MVLSRMCHATSQAPITSCSVSRKPGQKGPTPATAVAQHRLYCRYLKWPLGPLKWRPHGAGRSPGRASPLPHWPGRGSRSFWLAALASRLRRTVGGARAACEGACGQPRAGGPEGARRGGPPGSPHLCDEGQVAQLRASSWLPGKGLLLLRFNEVTRCKRVADLQNKAV